jgi:hypothetical protein
MRELATPHGPARAHRHPAGDALARSEERAAGGMTRALQRSPRGF